jgi:hypothetical protein
MDSNKNSFYTTINKFQQTNFLKYYFIKMKPLSLSPLTYSPIRTLSEATHLRQYLVASLDV